MKQKLGILAVIAMTSGFFHLSASALTPNIPIGVVVPVSAATRTTFAFAPSVFDLNQLTPAGVLNHKVTVYVAPDPLYISG